ncbi:MAG TPA: SCP2 sterol-binding domain-containing protein [Anaerolineae bacterium]|nr:SCP2 sterol-binding domain-containing protein [Anaerolineae bacterium]
MVTVEEIFAAMPAKLDTEKAAGLDLTIAFDLSGDQATQKTLVISDGVATIEEGLKDDADATLIMDGADYAAMATGELNPMTAFMTGKVKVEGDLGSVMKMQGIFDD